MEKIRFIKRYFTGKTLILVMALLLPQLANAYDFMVDGLCYNIIGDNEVEVTYYSSNTASYDYAIAYPGLYGDLIIPEIVTNEGSDYRVTIIGPRAFYRTSGITTVKLPESITKISADGFYECTGLKTINLPNALTSIGQYAFTNNTSLTRVTIPYSVTKIGMAAFYGCTLTSATISRSVSTSQGWGPFSGCTLDTLIIAGKGDFSLYDERGRQTGLGAGQSQMQINSIFIGSEITSLGQLGAKPTIVNCYANIPPICMNYTFANYDGELHVPSTSITAYFTAEYWQNFNNFNPDLTDKVILDKTNASLIQWETLALVATIEPNDSELKWSTTNSSIATVDENGIVTALKEGECEIFATLASNYAVYASCHITVSYPEITLSLNNESLEMNVGEEMTLNATITPDNTGLIPSWTSSDESVAIVENGVVTAVGEGECDITATVLDKIANCHVTVSGDVTIMLSIGNAILGASQMLTVYPSCSPDVPVELVVTSSDPSVALVRLVNRSNAPAQGLQSFPEKDMAMAYLNEVANITAESKAPAYASEKSIMIVGVQNGTATITVTTADGQATPAILNLRVVDVDGDSTITASDITCLYNYLLNSDESYIDTSDTDGDGFITSADITVLYNLMLGN